MENSFTTREIQPQDKSWIIGFIKNQWGTTNVISRRKEYHVETLPGFVAIQDNKYVGLITFSIENTECQIVTLNTVQYDSLNEICGGSTQAGKITDTFAKIDNLRILKISSGYGKQRQLDGSFAILPNYDSILAGYLKKTGAVKIT